MTQTMEPPGAFDPGFSREAVTRLSREKNEPDWMLERRLQGWRHFEATPLPTGAQRAWKYTDVSRLKFEGFLPHAPASASGTEMPPEPPAPASATGVLSQVNSDAGKPSLQAELPRSGVIFTSIDAALRDYPALVQKYFMTECVAPDWDKFSALHAAFWSGGAFVLVPKGVKVSLPLYSLMWGARDGLALFPHMLLIAEPGSEVTLVEEYASVEGGDGILSSGVTELFIGENATVRYLNLQRWGASVQHFGVQRALLDRDARLHFVTVGLGGRLSKVTGESVMRGPGSNSELLGLFYGRRSQQFDYVTLQDHQAPDTQSDLLFKSALNDRARAMYYGLVRVGPHAARANANQANRNLLLSGNARADSDPVLEILTSEVTRCTHGASVGPVDQEQLFYLQSRGIERSESEKLLVTGFLHEVTGRIPDLAVRERLEQAIDEDVDV